jgi:MoxR-like ATPase
VIIITSNAKKDLSDPFLGRCNFHHIAFPDPKMMRRIIGVHFPDIHDDLVDNAIAAFYHMRELEAVEKRPATRELINWIRALKPIRTSSPNGWPRATCPFWACCSKRAAITNGPVPLSTGERCSDHVPRFFL